MELADITLIGLGIWVIASIALGLSFTKEQDALRELENTSVEPLDLLTPTYSRLQYIIVCTGAVGFLIFLIVGTMSALKFILEYL